MNDIKFPQGYAKDLPTGYGRVKAVTVYNAREALRKAIMAEGTPAIQEAWDRLAQWVDAPQGLPISGRPPHGSN